MKRVLVLAVVAVAGLLTAGSSAQADHFRYSGHHHHSGYGGYLGGYSRSVSHYGYRPNYGVSIGIGYGTPVYRPYYGGGFNSGYYTPVYGYSVPVYNYGGYCR